jgi:hypothetical protein
LQLTLKNTTWKVIRKLPEWWLQIDNSKVTNDYYLLLCDSIDKCIHCFKIPANTITEPKEKFNQTKKKNSNNIVSNILIKRGDPDFIDHCRRQISFKKYYIKKILYPKNNTKQKQQDNDKTAREHMKDIIFKDKKLQKGQVITRQEIIDLFRKKHPDYKESGIDSYLRGLVVNDDSRDWYPHTERDDVLYKLEGRPVSYRLYDPEKDPPPIKNDTINKQKKAILIKKGIQFETNNSKNEKSSDSIFYTTKSNSFSESYEIAQKTEKYYNLINKNCANYGKERIFENVPEILELWYDIRTQCKSTSDFSQFITSLYMLFFETTKDKDPYGALDNKGYPKYNKRLPEKFTNLNTSTYRFMDIIGILRHVKGKAHLGSKLKIPPWKTSYPDALQELSGNKFEPETPRDFQNLQIEVLKRFKNAMEILHQMVKDELNPSKKKH